MLAINMADVVSVIKSIAPQLIAIVTLLVCALVVMFITRKRELAFKK